MNSELSESSFEQSAYERYSSQVALVTPQRRREFRRDGAYKCVDEAVDMQTKSFRKISDEVDTWLRSARKTRVITSTAVSAVGGTLVGFVSGYSPDIAAFFSIGVGAAGSFVAESLRSFGIWRRTKIPADRSSHFPLPHSPQVAARVAALSYLGVFAVPPPTQQLSDDINDFAESGVAYALTGSAFALVAGSLGFDVPSALEGAILGGVLGLAGEFVQSRRKMEYVRAMHRPLISRLAPLMFQPSSYRGALMGSMVQRWLHGVPD